jgi:hypothetical protein
LEAAWIHPRLAGFSFSGRALFYDEGRMSRPFPTPQDLGLKRTPPFTPLVRAILAEAEMV